MGLCAGGKLRSLGVHGHEGTYGYGFECPGCKRYHAVNVKVDPNAPHHPVWGFNGDVENPTFTPSLLVQWDGWEPSVTPENHQEWKRSPWQQHKVHHVCHSFIKSGQIQFLSDCTHPLAGKTVPLPVMSERGDGD